MRISLRIVHTLPGGILINLRFILALALAACLFAMPNQSHAQAALLLEEPYGFFGTLNPTGHNALYFSRICADTPTHLRRCQPGEPGAVISRYQGISGYDWIAIPLIPYLYAVDDARHVPSRVDRQFVDALRERYHERNLLSLGADLKPGGMLHGGWAELIGVAYDRRIYAYRFQTSEAADDALIERLNREPNRSEFDLIYSNCADFARELLNSYFPGTFKRTIFPDAGMTTPKQTAGKLVRYAHHHPQIGLQIFVIPQIHGYRRHSHSNRGVAESLATTIYAVPLTLANPYIAGGLAIDYLVRGRFQTRTGKLVHLTPLTLDRLSLPADKSLTAPHLATDNPHSANPPEPIAPAAATDAEESRAAYE